MAPIKERRLIKEITGNKTKKSHLINKSNLNDLD